MSEEFSSALIYLITFLSSTGLFWAGQRLYAYNRSGVGIILRKFIFFLAVLIPSLLAGFRANSVGIDIRAYIIPNMRTARSFQVRSLSDCFAALDMAPEYLYMFLVYICSRITADEGLLLFMVQFLTIAPIALAAIKLRRELSIPLTMATYLFCFYNNTLNMMRQSVTCAFILLGAVFLFKNDMKMNSKTVTCFVIAVLFHKSALMGIIPIYVLCKVSTLRLKRWAYIMIYGACILVPVISTPVFELLDSWGWVSENIASYADIFLYRTGRQDWFVENVFSIGFIGMTLCLLGRIAVPCFYLRHCGYFDDAGITTVRSAALCGTMINLIVFYSMQTIYGNRLSVFFDLFLVLLVPFAARGKRKKEKRVVLWTMVITFWILYVIVLKWSGESDIYRFRF